MKTFIAIVLTILGFALAAFTFSTIGTISVVETTNEYAVSNVTYTYDSANPTIITYVDFDIYPPLHQVSVSLVQGGALTDCGALTANGTHAHCPVNVSVSAANMLRIATSE